MVRFVLANFQILNGSKANSKSNSIQLIALGSEKIAALLINNGANIPLALKNDMMSLHTGDTHYTSSCYPKISKSFFILSI